MILVNFEIYFHIQHFITTYMQYYQFKKCTKYLNIRYSNELF